MSHHHKSILDGYTLNWIRRHKAAKTIIKVPMSKSRRRFLRQIFDGFDEDGGGDIDFTEFRKAVQFADPRATYEQAYQLFRSIDLDDGGTIDFEEFCHGMERKEAEDANNKKPTESNNKDSDEDHMHHVAINHQRSSQLEVINSNRIKDTLKLKSFRALFKTHALTFPSNNEEDSEIAKAENKAHLAHIRMRREYGSTGTDRFARKNKERTRQCIIGVTTNVDENLEPYGLYYDDFDDIVQKPLTLQSFKASLVKIDSLNPHELKLGHGGNLHILVADTSSTAASLHGRMLAAVGHHIIYQDGIVEDQIINGNFDVLLTSTLCLNNVSQKPIVRHIRDHEREQIRRLMEAQEVEISKERKKELKAASMVSAHTIPFPDTYIAEDKSFVYESNIRLKSFAEVRSLNEDRKLVDNEILATVGLRKSKSHDILSSPSLSLSLSSSLSSGQLELSYSSELKKVLAEIEQGSTSTASAQPSLSELRPDTAESHTSSLLSHSRPGTSQSRPGTCSQSRPGTSKDIESNDELAVSNRPLSRAASPVHIVPSCSSPTSLPDIMHSSSSSSSSSSPSLLSSSPTPNVRTLKSSSSSSISPTLLRPINVIKTHNSFNTVHSRASTSPSMLRRAAYEPSFDDDNNTSTIIRLPSSITRASRNNNKNKSSCTRNNPGIKRKVKSNDDLEKMI